MEHPIYYAANEAEAGCIVSLLRDKGLQGRWYERDEVAQLPFAKQCVVAVSQHDIQEAEAILHAARKDQIISLHGVFASSPTHEGKKG
ncbi:MAG: hypothetical protein AAF320_02830 [Myxococcota bacterium]